MNRFGFKIDKTYLEDSILSSVKTSLEDSILSNVKITSEINNDAISKKVITTNLENTTESEITDTSLKIMKSKGSKHKRRIHIKGGL